MANPAIVVDFIANTKDLASGFKDAEGKAGGFGSKLKGIAKGGALAAGAAGIGGLVATLKIGVGEWKDSTKVAAQTQAVIKSTGGVANVTKGHVDKLSESLMKKSGVDDEVISSGENMLLTFTNVRDEVGKGNDIFDQATTAALDMSTAMGTDMKNAAKDLGKALNDPEKGVGKLQRSGVTFTDSQKKLITKLQESGDMLGAQKIILGEVKKEFGGSAEAAGKTLPGQLNVLKETFNNLAGDLVGKLIPVLQDTITWLRDHWPEITKAFNDFWNSVKPTLKDLWDLLKAVAQVVADNWPLIKPILDDLAKQFKDAMKIIGDVIKVITDVLKGDWSQAWQDAKKLVVDAVNAVKDHLLREAKIIGDAALGLGKAILNGIKDGVGALTGWIRDKLSDAKDAITGLAESVYNAAKGFGGKILSGIADGASGVWTKVRGEVDNALDAIDGLLESAYNKAKAFGGKILSGIKDGIGDVVHWATSIGTSIINAIKGELKGFKIPAITIKGHHITPDFRPFAKLAAGGIVTGPTYALVGEAGPEAVIPLSGSGVGSPAIEVRVFIGDTELTGIIRAEIADTNTGIARSLLAGAG